VTRMLIGGPRHTVVNFVRRLVLCLGRRKPVFFSMHLNNSRVTGSQAMRALYVCAWPSECEQPVKRQI